MTDLTTPITFYQFLFWLKIRKHDLLLPHLREGLNRIVCPWSKCQVRNEIWSESNTNNPKKVTMLAIHGSLRCCVVVVIVDLYMHMAELLIQF